MGKKSGTSYHEFTSGQETIHLVQPYRMVKKRGLTPVDALRVDSPTAARERAKRLFETVKSRVVCKSERKLLDASVRLPWRPPSVREA